MAAAYQLRNLKFGYTATPVLAIAELNIESAGITALIGPNGAGKSTLLQLLAFLHPAHAGEHQFFGTPVCAADLPRLCQQVALVQQNPYLLRGTVRRNIELGLRLRRVPADERDRRVDAILSQLSLGPLATRSVNRLSGGEAQKVAIARALVLNPKVLLLDEPFTHLDRAFHTTLETLLRELPKQQHCTIVFSSHDLLRAQSLAETVFSLVNGTARKSSLANLYHGHIDSQHGYFDTGCIQIVLADRSSKGTHLAIEPAHIVLSRTRLDSSIRNTYRGHISALRQVNGQVRISVEAGEHFEVLITHDALQQQGFGLAQEVWISFKSTSVQVF